MTAPANWTEYTIGRRVLIISGNSAGRKGTITRITDYWGGNTRLERPTIHTDIIHVTLDPTEIRPEYTRAFYIGYARLIAEGTHDLW